MDVRLVVAIARQIDEGVPVTRLCEQLGISRQTFYVYRRRYAEEGLAGLVSRSRAPRLHPNMVSVDREEAVLLQRKVLADQGLDYGARSVWAWMTRAGEKPPSARTIHRIFVRRGLVDPQPQKRPRSSYRRFQAAQPNGIWQIDGMRWLLADGTEVTVIRVIDDCSRKVFKAVVAPTESGAAAWACVDQAMQQFGRPAMLLSDNSLAFNGRRRNVEVELTKRLAELGVATVSSRQYHPGTCGKNEREHQTLQHWLQARPAAAGIEQLQTLIDTYDGVYNSRRPHQALGGLDTPNERYEALPKAAAADHPLPAQQRITEVKVSARGSVPAGADTDVQIGREWEGVTVQVARSGNHVAIYHGDSLIHTTAIDPTRRYQPSRRPRGGRLQPRRAGAQPNQPPQRSEDERS